MAMIRKMSTDPAEQELTEAVRRIQERYGKDLDLFFKEVRERSRPNQNQPELPLFDSNPTSKDRDDNTAA